MGTINVTKRLNGGFTVVISGVSYYLSEIRYQGYSSGVILISSILPYQMYPKEEWTIQTVTNFETIAAVCNALDELGISADTTEDIKVLVQTIDADTGNIATNTANTKTSVDLVKTSSDSVKASVDLVKTSTDAVKTSVDGVKTTSDLIKTAVDAIKTAVETLDNFISGSKGLVTEDNSAAIKTAVNTVMGQDFLCITDTSAHTGLDCTSIYVMNDAVFTDITIGGSNVVAGKGLTGITIVAGTLLPLGKTHATSITLASGKVIANIN